MNMIENLQFLLFYMCYRSVASKLFSQQKTNPQISAICEWLHHLISVNPQLMIQHNCPKGVVQTNNNNEMWIAAAAFASKVDIPWSHLFTKSLVRYFKLYLIVSHCDMRINICAVCLCLTSITTIAVVFILLYFSRTAVLMLGCFWIRNFITSLHDGGLLSKWWVGV